jgi:hypothetical protein
MPELLHPRMANVYRQKVGSLCRALESEESRTGAVDAIRALVETILRHGALVVLGNLFKEVFRRSLRHHRGQRNLPFPRISHRRDDSVDGFL